MFGIFDKIEEFFKDLLLGGIQANLESRQTHEETFVFRKLDS